MKPILTLPLCMGLTLGLSACGSGDSNSNETATTPPTTQPTQPAANQSPVAAFGFNCSGLSCQFDSSDSRDSDGTITTTAWDFGDNNNATATTVQHSYSNPGEYSVTLTVTDNDGASHSITHQISVTDATVQVDPADVIFTNAKIYGHANTEAVAVDEGKIVAIGSGQQLQAYIDSDTQVVDLNSNYLLPGFIDNHNHLGEGGEVTCEPKNDISLARQAAFLRQCAVGVPAGDWIIGYGGDFNIEYDATTKTSNTLALLDNLFPNNPVIIMDFTSHAMFTNSLAYAEVGVTKETANPQGGIYMKDAGGELNGILIDNAGDVIMEKAVNSLDGKFDIIVEGITYGLDVIRKNGITTVGDGRTYWKRGMFDGWKQVFADGKLTARISVRPWIYPEVEFAEQLQFLQGAYQNDIEQLLIVNQVKMYSDGIPEMGSARVIEPYASTPFPEFPHGFNYITESNMIGLLQNLQAMGYGAHIHAIGDLGVRESLNAIEAARDNGSKLEYNITHLHMMDPADLNRFAQLDVDADIQLGGAPGGEDELEEYASPVIGKQRAGEILHTPVKALYESNANVVLSSDWTVNPVSPMSAIAVAAEESSLNISAAIDAYTINAARALGLESITGSITVGKSADFVVVDRDLAASTPAQIRNAKVLRTVLQGKTVYSQATGNN